MLARAQEIENLEKQVRAQALIGEETRASLVRAEAAYGQAASQLVGMRREAGDAQASAHSLSIETLRLSQQAEQSRERSSQIEADLAEITARLEARNASEAELLDDLISTAGTIGAEGLSDAARSLQLALDAGEAERWPALLEAFSHQHARVTVARDAVALVQAHDSHFQEALPVLFGHIGEGNLHLNVLRCPLEREEELYAPMMDLMAVA